MKSIAILGTLSLLSAFLLQYWITPSESTSFLQARFPNLDLTSCNIRKVQLSANPTAAEILRLTASNVPVILLFDNPSRNAYLKSSLSLLNLEQSFGNTKVQLSSSNSYSYSTKTVHLKEYIATLHDSLNASWGNETFYLFGGLSGDPWDGFTSSYEIPSFTPKPALSLGIGGAASGVAFHHHGSGFSEVLVGTKRWYLHPPSLDLQWDPDRSHLQYIIENGSVPLFQCNISPGMMLHFPNEWTHATLNLETYNAFISTFL